MEHAKVDIEKITKNTIGPLQVYEYLTAPFGHTAGIYPDGSFFVGDSVGDEIAENERPIATVKCPGIGNIDPTYHVEGWTEMDEETGELVVTEGSEGCEKGDRLTLEQAIYISCADGDVAEEIEDLREKFYIAFVS